MEPMLLKRSDFDLLMSYGIFCCPFCFQDYYNLEIIDHKDIQVDIKNDPCPYLEELSSNSHFFRCKNCGKIFSSIYYENEINLNNRAWDIIFNVSIADNSSDFDNYVADTSFNVDFNRIVDKLRESNRKGFSQ